jgi:hypothetical protein
MMRSAGVGSHFLAWAPLLCERCGRDLMQRWEKPGDLSYDEAVVILPRDDGTDSFWCLDCWDSRFNDAFR